MNKDGAEDRIGEALLKAFAAEDADKLRQALSLTLENEVVLVRFPHRFFADWFQHNGQDRFEQAMVGVGLGVAYGFRDQDRERPAQEPRLAGQTLPFGAEFIFDNFLVNNKNAFPLASAQEVAQSQNAHLNPFVLCGESGSGKSFLLRAIANVKSEQGPQDVFVAGIEEMHELFTSRRDARKFLMSKNFLGVDDLQDIARYQYLQNELIVIFDHCHDRRKQMAFACAGKMAGYTFLLPKLKSRLEWGLIVTLKAPDLDIRTRYAMSRGRELQMDLSKERILLLAHRFSDLRNLEGCLLKLWAYRELVRDQISDDEFDNILNYLDDRPRVSLTAEQIMDTVCAQMGVGREELLSSGRKHETVFARQVAMFLCRRHLGLSFPELGKTFGGRDHSTVLYSCRKIEQLQRDDKSVKSMLHALSEKCLVMNEKGVA
ncbi:MAG: chromosomal replication initiator DnaA [Desulfovibrionales bacterium]|nr:chromosomal replication initiator DnaA [Desulfovibrionales bacterium]